MQLPQPLVEVMMGVRVHNRARSRFIFERSFNECHSLRKLSSVYFFHSGCCIDELWGTSVFEFSKEWAQVIIGMHASTPLTAEVRRREEKWVDLILRAQLPFCRCPDDVLYRSCNRRCLIKWWILTVGIQVDHSVIKPQYFCHFIVPDCEIK